MKPPIFGISLIIIVLLCNCQEDQTLTFDEDTLFQIHEDDMVYFNGNETQIKIFVSWFDWNGYEVYLSGYDFAQGLSYHYLDYLPDSYVYEGPERYVSRSPLGASIYWENFNERIIYLESEYGDYMIGDHVFKYVFSLLDNKNVDSLHFVSKVYYTDRYGVIAYELYNRELYEIDVEHLKEIVKIKSW